MEILRFEKKNIESICDFVKAEYVTAKSSDGCEQDTIRKILSSDSYIPKLTFEAWDNGFLIGFIMLYKTGITDSNGNEYEVLSFGPAAVKQSHRSRGVGSAMVRYSLRQAKWLGYGSVVISGKPDFYGKFGFVSTASRATDSQELMHLDLNPPPQIGRIFVGA